MGADTKVIAIFQPQDGIVSLTQLAGTFGDRVQDRANIGRRGGDHLEDVGATRLGSQSLLQIAGPGLHLIEQPDVFDGDHRLVGESGYKLDLLVREPPHRFPGQHDNADRIPFSHQRDAKYGTIVSPRTLFDVTVFGIGVNIDNLDRFSLEHGSSKVNPNG